MMRGRDWVRNWGVLVAILVVAGLSAGAQEGGAPTQMTPVAGIYNVVDFGAVGDGVADNTEAFQKAIDAAHANGGGTVKVPVGKFLIKTHIVVAENVTLEGIWTAPVRGVPVVTTGDVAGSVLLAVEGKGSTEGPPFILLDQSATLKGIIVFYPEQVNSSEPIPYPWCVAGQRDNPNIVDCMLVNPYQAVDFGSRFCGRHYIRNLYGQAIFKGIYINQCYDVGRVENVHFWPYWTGPNREEPALVWTREHGTAFLLGKTDGQMFTNCFAIRYKVGMHFFRGEVGTKPDGTIRTAPGSGVYTNCYMDESQIAVLVDDVGADSGISFVNGMFMSRIVVNETNKGQVKFTACGFWSNPDVPEHAKLAGRGTVFFNSCHFAKWDRLKQGVPCIDANNQSVIITGSEFWSDRTDHLKVRLGPEIRSAIITSNRMMGRVLIDNKSLPTADVQIGFNTAQ